MPTRGGGGPPAGSCHAPTPGAAGDPRCCRMTERCGGNTPAGQGAGRACSLIRVGDTMSMPIQTGRASAHCDGHAAGGRPPPAGSCHAPTLDERGAQRQLVPDRAAWGDKSPPVRVVVVGVAPPPLSLRGGDAPAPAVRQTHLIAAPAGRKGGSLRPRGGPRWRGGGVYTSYPWRCLASVWNRAPLQREHLPGGRGRPSSA